MEIPVRSGHFRLGPRPGGQTSARPNRGDVAGDDSRCDGREWRTIRRLLPTHGGDVGETSRRFRQQHSVPRRRGVRVQDGARIQLEREE